MQHADTLILVRDARDVQRVERVGRTLRRCRGVVSVVIPRRSSVLLGGHLLLVVHDSAHIGPQTVLGHVTSAGFSARLID